MRINKYLAEKQYASRRGADELIKNKQVLINGRVAVLGDEVTDKDKVEVKKGKADKTPVYFAYNKPVGVITHSPQHGEKDIKAAIAPQLKGNKEAQDLFPVGRLDKDSRGLIILTNDGRITGKLLDPEEAHEKEYVVEVNKNVPETFEAKMERGVSIEDGDGRRFKTKPCIVKMISDRKFVIILTEGKKRQIRRMCEACGVQVKDLKRVRIMGIELGNLEENTLRRIKGDELETFMEELGVKNPARS